MIGILRRFLDSQSLGDICHSPMAPRNENVPFAVVPLDMLCYTLGMVALAGGINRKAEVFSERVDGIEGASVVAVCEDRVRHVWIKRQREIKTYSSLRGARGYIRYRMESPLRIPCADTLLACSHPCSAHGCLDLGASRHVGGGRLLGGCGDGGLVWLKKRRREREPEKRIGRGWERTT